MNTTNYIKVVKKTAAPAARFAKNGSDFKAEILSVYFFDDLDHLSYMRAKGEARRDSDLCGAEGVLYRKVEGRDDFPVTGYGIDTDGTEDEEQEGL